MRIRMTRDYLSAPDGVFVRELAAGSEHDFPDEYALHLVDEGVAAVADEASADDDGGKPARGRGRKAKAAAPENKAAAGDAPDGADAAGEDGATS